MLVAEMNKERWHSSHAVKAKDNLGRRPKVSEKAQRWKNKINKHRFVEFQVWIPKKKNKMNY